MRERERRRRRKCYVLQKNVREKIDTPLQRTIESEQVFKGYFNWSALVATVTLRLANGNDNS